MSNAVTIHETNMSSPRWNVSILDNLIMVRLKGDWTIADDLAYLDNLDRAMRKVHGKPWALYVDMRGWKVTQKILNFKHETTFHLDRRNQKLEIWLVDDPKQGQFLEHYIRAARLPFHKFLDEPSALSCLREKGYSLAV